MTEGAIPNEMTGGEALARSLIAHGAGPMFGMGGFQLLPFYDAARRLGLNHNLINDERCAAFAADAYAKVSGRVGLVDATLGPGATNLVTGLVEALNAGSPVVAVVGDAHRDHAGRNMTQETDQVAILRPACKALIRVEAVHRIPEAVARAFPWQPRAGRARWWWTCPRMSATAFTASPRAISPPIPPCRRHRPCAAGPNAPRWNAPRRCWRARKGR
ncbi:MAG: hypothetical protein KatS3mg118_2259 [Paracoccaceae bacterium]|nr:MAG: hypothetical protein KatS3mg118_2259 [Paracoccaceae bacterium]